MATCSHWCLLVLAIEATLVATVLAGLPIPPPQPPEDFPDFSGNGDEYVKDLELPEPTEGFCESSEKGFPGKEKQRLDSPQKRTKFANDIPDAQTKSVFGVLNQPNPVMDISESDVEDVMDFVAVLADDGEDLLTLILTNADLTTGRGFQVVVRFVVDHPQILPMLKKKAAQHILASLTRETMDDMCENLDESDLPEIRIRDIMRDFPQCVVVAQRHIKNMTKHGMKLRHGGVMLDRIRSTGKRLNVSDFLIDPTGIEVGDVDELLEGDLKDMVNLKLIGKVMHKLDEDVLRRIAERLDSVLGNPDSWSPQLMKVMGKLMMHLPDNLLQQHISDDMVEMFLNGSYKINKKIVSFMVESLYDKRNSPSFHKRFCLAIHHLPYITVSILDDFTPMELWQALKECPRFYYEMAYEHDYMMMDEEEDEYYYDGEDDDAERNGGGRDGQDGEGYGKDYFHQEFDPDNFEDAFKEDVIGEFIQEMTPNLKQLRPLLRKIFSKKNMTWNETHLHEIAMFLPAAPTKVFEDLPAKLLMKMWPKLQRFGKFPMKTLHVVMDKIGDHLPDAEHANASTAHLLGQAILALPCSDIHDFPDEQLLKFVLTGYFRENKHFSCEYNENICRAIATKALHGSPKKLRKLVVKNLGKLGKYLDGDDFEEDEIFHNEYFPEHLEKDMFKKKEKEEKEKIERSDPDRFGKLSDEERVFEAFVKDGAGEKEKTEKKGKKLGYKEALLVKFLEMELNGTSFNEHKFTKKLGDKKPKRFNISYLETVDFNDFEHDFSLKRFGDIEDFVSMMFDITLEDIVGEMINGEIDPDMMDFEDEDEDDYELSAIVNEDFLEDIPENEESLEFLKDMKDGLKGKAGKKGGSVDRKQLSSGFKTVKKMFQLDGNKTDICLDDSVIEDLDCFFTRARKHELDNLSNKTRKSILKAEGKSEECVASMSKDQIHEHFESLLEVDDELRDAREWNEDLLMKSGPAMLCGMEEDHVTKLTPQAAMRFSAKLCGCKQLSNGARTALFNKIKEFYNNDISNMFKPPYNMDAASCLMYAPPSELRGMNAKAKKIFVGMASRLLEEIQEHLDGIHEMGFGMEELVEEQASAEELASAVWIIMGELDVPPMDRLSHLSKFKNVINVDFIEELSKEDFAEAVDFLQDFDGWTWAQKEALATKVEEVFGDLEDWSGFDLLRLGGLLSATIASNDDFGDVQFDECAMDYVLEKFSDNEDLFESVCERLTMENALKMIKKQPQAVCCLDMADAAKLNASFIMKAFDSMEECHPCLKKRSDLLGEFARIVSDDLRSNETSKDVFEDLKCLVGKMPKDFLERLPTDRFERFDADAIRVMDAEDFCKLAGDDYLKGMNELQADAVDDPKLACLDKDQFEAFWQAIDGGPEDDEFDDDDDEIFPDFSITSIGDSEEFEEFKSNFSRPTMQSGGDKEVMCASPRGENVKGVSDAGKRKLRGVLDGDELDLFNELDYNPHIDFSMFSEADLVELMEEIHETFGDTNFTEYLSDLSTMVADPSVKDYDSKLSDVFVDLNPQVYTMIEPDVLCNSLKQLKKKHLEVLCGRLLEDDVSTHTFITVNSQCPVCITYWIKQRKNEKFYNIFDKKIAAAFYGMRLRRKKPMDLETLTLGPKGVTPDIIKAVDKKSFSKISQLTALTHPNVGKHLPKNSIKLILKKIIKALGPVKKWNKLIKSRLQFFLFHLPRKELKDQLSPSDIIEILTANEGEVEGLEDEGIRKMLGQAVNKYIMKNHKNIDKSILESPGVFCLLLSSGMPRKLLDPTTTIYHPDFLLKMIGQCSDYYDISESASRKFLRRILNTITAKDKAHLEEMKDFMGLMSPKDLSKFPKPALKDLWDDVKDQHFNEKQLRVFWNAIKSDISTLDCRAFESLGPLVRVVPRSKFASADLFDCLSDVMEAVEYASEEAELPKSILRGLWNMIKKKLKGKSMTVSDFVMSEDFSPRIASIIPKPDYDGLNLDMKDKAVREKAFKIAEYIDDDKNDLIANMFDDLDLDDPETQEQVLENDDVARVVFSYMDDDDLDSLQSGDSEGSMLEKQAENVEHMSTKSLEKNFGLMKKRINMTDKCEKESICMDDGQAWVMASLFVGARPNEMECLTKTTLKIIMERIGQSKKLCNRMTSAVIKKLFSLVDPLEASTAGEDLDILYGCMMCGFTKAQIQSLTDEQVVELQDTLSGCYQFDRDVKDLIMEKIIRNYGGFTKYLESNPDVGIGSRIMNVPLNDIKNLDEDSLEYVIAALGDITSELTEELDDLKTRKGRGEITTAKFDAYFEVVNQILAALYDQIAPASVPVRRRKKRAVVNSDEECDILADFNGNLCFLTEDQINALTDQAVADCASEFQGCDYSEDKFTTLATKAKTSLGTVSDWETSDYESLGKLLGYMGDSTIEEMELTDDVMDVIPNVKIENGDDIFNQYLSHNNKNLTELTGENIADYSLLLGSLSAEELNDLEPSAVGDAVNIYNLGGEDLSQLDDDVVELYTNKLIESDSFNFTGASSSDVSNLGVLAGKLPENVLSDLSTEQKSGISADAIQLIDPDVLAVSFTASDFAALTSEQANALSEDQLGELSSSQRSIVATISTTVLDDDDDDGGHACTISSSLGLLTTLLVFSFWTLRWE